METDDSLKLQNQLCFALYAATHAITRAYRSRLDPINLTYPQYLVMLVLWEQDGLPVKDLAARLQQDSGTLSPILKRLENNGFLQRDRNTSDERVVNICLTEAGQRLKQQVRNLQQEVVCQTGLEPDQFSELISTLHELTSTLTARQHDVDTELV